MSNDVFPTLPGLAWDVGKSPSFNTDVQRSVSGSESRIGLQAYPLYEFEMKYQYLGDGQRGTDLKKLVGLFLKMRGSLDSFLFTDPSDNSVTDQNIGTGDGTNRVFAMTRTYGDTFTFTEPVTNINAITNVKINGVAETHYTVAAGVITFDVGYPPGAGLAVTWTGSYYFRSRFLKDQNQFSKFMYDLWELKKLQLLGSLQSKI